MIASVAARPAKTSAFEATVVWMHSKPLRPGSTYLAEAHQPDRPRDASLKSAPAFTSNISSTSAEQLALNDIGQVVIETSRPLLADLYRDSRATGSLILIDRCRQHHRGRGHDSRNSRRRSDSAINRATPGLLIIGNRADLAVQIEQSLLRTAPLSFARAFRSLRNSLTIARLGAFVILESDEPRPDHIHPC